RYAATGEDISHAGCQVMFAQACARDSIVFGEADLRAMARTLETIIFRHGDVPCEFIRGYSPGLDVSIGVWSTLTRFTPAVLQKITAVVETILAEGSFDFAKEGWGVRVLAQIELA